MARLSDDGYDRALVLLALLAPLLMFALNKWRASLETWYVAPEANPAVLLLPDVGPRAIHWLKTSGEAETALILIASRSCPCTSAALSLLQEAARAPSKKSAPLKVQFIEEPPTDQLTFDAWQQLLKTIPATPTLLVIESERLLYAGPVNSGSFCSNAINQVLGVSLLGQAAASPQLNWLAKGCYCHR